MMIRRLMLVVVMLAAAAAASHAAVVQEGEIRGTVRDAETGEPLIGANVIVEGTPLGAAVDVDGGFRIVRVPPGVYSVSASMIGYERVTMTDVRVSIDRVTELNFELRVETIEGGEVMIVAERQAVNVEVTSSAKLITSEEIERIPAITNVQDLMRLQTGVVASDENIHIRGGRGDEVLYLIDGVPANNPVTGVNAFQVDLNQIEEVEIITGGFDAEYGNAQSGIINIITKRGRDYYSVEAVTKTDEIFPADVSTSYTYGYLGLSGPFEPLRLLGVPGRTGFNISLNGTLDDTHQRIGGGYGRTDFGLFSIPNRQRSEYAFSGGLDYSLKGFRAKVTYRDSRSASKSFNWSWIRNAENLPISTDHTRRITTIFTQTLPWNAFIQLSAGYSRSKSHSGLLDLASPLDAFQFVSTYFDTLGQAIPMEEIDAVLRNDPGRIDFSRTRSEYARPEIPIDSDNDGFIDSGSSQNWTDYKADVIDIDLDLTKHIGRVHQFKTGINITGKRIDYLGITDYGSFHPSRDSLPGPWPEYGRTRWYFSDIPWDGSAYMQDKIEYAGMYLNLGVRVDFYRHGSTLDDPDFIIAFNRATGDSVTTFKRNRFVWSPRLGLSIPANKDTKLFFNYGFFTQLPTFGELYRSPFLSDVVGNPRLRPRTSSTYEVGIETEFVPNWVLLAKLYGRDFAGSIGFRNTDTVPSRVIYENTGFGSSRGFEIELRKIYSGYVGATINYTYLLARGFDLTALDQFERGSIVPPPVREQRVGWDVNQTANVYVDVHVPRGRKPRLLGVPLEGMSISVLGQVLSGYPYTPIIPGALRVEPNSNTGPLQFYIDLTLSKDFYLKTSRFTVFSEILNLLDYSNVNVGSSGFNRRTGELLDLGDLDGGTSRYLTYREVLFRRSSSTFGPGRRIRLGLKFYVQSR